MGRARWSAAVAVVPVLLLGACGGAGEAADPGEAAAPPPGVSMALLQERMDIATGQVAIRVENHGAAPIRVTAATYDDPRLTARLEWRGESDIPAGGARHLRVDVPAPACDVEQSSSPGAGRLWFAAPEGEASADYEVTDRFDFVAGYVATECFAARLGAAATIALARVTTEPGDDGEVAVLELSLSADAEAAIRIESVAGTVLLRPDGDGVTWEPDVTVAPGVPETLKLRAVPQRCDPHAIAEDKVGTRLRATVTILAEPPATGVYTVVAAPTQRSALFDYLARRCQLPL